MGNVTIRGQQTLTCLSCWVCGIEFAMPHIIERKRAEDGKAFFCPNGDKISYGPSLLDRERSRLLRMEAQLTHERDQREAAERSAAAYRGQVTKIKRRVGNGVCPCCKRSFANLARHMEGQHPGFATDA
jgi:hypothetical protein